MHIKTENVHLNSTDIRRIYYEAFLQEIIIANGKFIKRSFDGSLLSIVMVLYGQRFGSRQSRKNIEF